MHRLLVCTLLLFIQILRAQTNGTILNDNINRNFVYYVPSSWNESQQWPLVIVLHGLTQTGAGVMNITQFNDLAENNHFIVCYPDGINNAWNANMNITVSNADDIGFIEKLALYFQNSYHTDPIRQYLVGFSNGGFMSYKMVCESKMCFAALAVVSATMSDTVYSNCNPTFRPSLLHIHGTSDFVVPYDGSSQTGVSVLQAIDKWKGYLNCDATPTIINMPDNNLLDLSNPQEINYINCDAPLQHIKINGGGHQWPGINTLVGGTGTINMDFYSPQYIWDFLSNKVCPSASIDAIPSTNIHVYPNPTKNKLKLMGIPPNSKSTIWDLKGIEVRHLDNETEIDVTNMNSGIYILQIERKENTERILWLKE